MRNIADRWVISSGRLVGGVAVLGFGAMWRYQGIEGHVFVEAGRLPQLRAGDVVTIPAFVAAIALTTTAFVTTVRRRVLGGLLAGTGLAYPLFSYPWDGRVVFGQHHHGIHSTDAVALVILAGAIVALMTTGDAAGRRPYRRGGPLGPAAGSS